MTTDQSEYILILFSLLGVTNSVDDKMNHVLTQQLSYSANQIYKDMNLLAAEGIELSQQISLQIEKFNTPFVNLRNNVAQLTKLQEKTVSIYQALGNVKIKKAHSHKWKRCWDSWSLTQ